MFRNSVVAEIKSEADRVHSYTCPPETPPEEAYHILGLIRAHVFEQMKAQEEADAKALEEAKSKVDECEKVKPCECEAVVEEVKPEVVT